MNGDWSLCCWHGLCSVPWLPVSTGNSIVICPVWAPGQTDSADDHPVAALRSPASCRSAVPSCSERSSQDALHVSLGGGEALTLWIVTSQTPTHIDPRPHHMGHILETYTLTHSHTHTHTHTHQSLFTPLSYYPNMYTCTSTVEN